MARATVLRALIVAFAAAAPITASADAKAAPAHRAHHGVCGAGVREAPASLVCYKLPETGSTWFAELLNDHGDSIAVQHQWVKESWEDAASRRYANSRVLAERRGEFLRLAARCPTRRGLCYGDENVTVRQACLAPPPSRHGGGGAARGADSGSCAVGPRPGATVRGMTLNPTRLKRANATADALCGDLLKNPARKRLLVAFYRANVVKSSLSHVLKHAAKARNKTCTTCGQVARERRDCQVGRLRVNASFLLQMSREKYADTLALFRLAADSCWPVAVASYEQLQTDAAAVIAALLSDLAPPRRRGRANRRLAAIRNREDASNRIANLPEVAAHFEAAGAPDCLRRMLASGDVEAFPDCYPLPFRLREGRVTH